MFKSILHLGAFIIIFFSLSCSNEVDINADWQDIPVVYGLLDPSADTQFIKINRAFLGEGDATEMAKHSDSIHYAYKLNVRVEKWTNGSLKKTYLLDTLTIEDTKEGEFASDHNMVYFFKTPLSSDPINTDSEYKLIIENPVTGKVMESKTAIVKSFSLEKPYLAPIKPTLAFYSGNHYSTNLVFEWESASEAIIHEIKLRFYYKEFHIGQQDSVQKYVDIKLGEDRSLATTGGELLSVTYQGELFYSQLSRSITADPSIGRVAGSIGNNLNQLNIIITAAGDDLSTYIDIHKPSGSLVQEKPEFSNISNAVGLFSSRYTKTSKNIRLSLDSDYELKNGNYTKALNFM